MDPIRKALSLFLSACLAFAPIRAAAQVRTIETAPVAPAAPIPAAPLLAPAAGPFLPVADFASFRALPELRLFELSGRPPSEPESRPLSAGRSSLGGANRPVLGRPVAPAGIARADVPARNQRRAEASNPSSKETLGKFGRGLASAEEGEAGALIERVFSGSKPRSALEVEGDPEVGNTVRRRGLSAQGHEGGPRAASGGRAPRSGGSRNAIAVFTAAAILAGLPSVEAQDAASRALPQAAASGALALIAKLIPVGPLAYGLYRWRAETKAGKTGPVQDFRGKIGDAIEGGVHALGAALLSLIGLGLSHGTSAEPLVIAAGAWFSSQVALEHLGSLRSVVVGGWQASHDQRYRVGMDGRLRDVRGHKYGSDRYEARAQGPVSPAEKLVWRTWPALAGSFAFWGAGFWMVFWYNLLLTLFFALTDWIEARRTPPFVSAEDAEHARKFSRAVPPRSTETA